MLAHHYVTALELDRAAGVEAGDLATRARFRLREAGDRAYVLSAFPAARRFYGAAIELWPEDDDARADLLFRYARAAHAEMPTQSLELITDARDALLAAGDRAQTAEAEILISEVFWLLGSRDEGFARVNAARALIADQPNSYSKAYVVANVSRYATLAGEHEDGIRVGREALAMAEELQIDPLRSHALNNIGIARVATGDMDGIDDLEQSASIALEANSIESVRAYGNLASVLYDLGELERGWLTSAEALRLGERFGVADWLRWIRGDRCWGLYYQGRWDEMVEQLDAYVAEAAESGFWIETSFARASGSNSPRARRPARGAGGCRSSARARRGGQGSPGRVAVAGLRRARRRWNRPWPRRAPCFRAPLRVGEPWSRDRRRLRVATGSRRRARGARGNVGASRTDREIESQDTLAQGGGGVCVGRLWDRRRHVFGHRRASRRGPGADCARRKPSSGKAAGQRRTRSSSARSPFGAPSARRPTFAREKRSWPRPASGRGVARSGTT